MAQLETVYGPLDPKLPVTGEMEAPAVHLPGVVPACV